MKIVEVRKETRSRGDSMFDIESLLAGIIDQPKARKESDPIDHFKPEQATVPHSSQRMRHESESV